MSISYRIKLWHQKSINIVICLSNIAIQLSRIYHKIVLSFFISNINYILYIWTYTQSNNILIKNSEFFLWIYTIYKIFFRYSCMFPHKLHKHPNIWESSGKDVHRKICGILCHFRGVYFEGGNQVVQYLYRLDQ